MEKTTPPPRKKRPAAEETRCGPHQTRPNKKPVSSGIETPKHAGRSLVTVSTGGRGGGVSWPLNRSLDFGGALTACAASALGEILEDLAAVGQLTAPACQPNREGGQGTVGGFKGMELVFCKSCSFELPGPFDPQVYAGRGKCMPFSFFY